MKIEPSIAQAQQPAMFFGENTNVNKQNLLLGVRKEKNAKLLLL